MSETCKHEEGEIKFGKILDIDTERVEIAFIELCQICGKKIDKGSFIYTRKD